MPSSHQKEEYDRLTEVRNAVYNEIQVLDSRLLQDLTPEDRQDVCRQLEANKAKYKELEREFAALRREMDKQYDHEHNGGN